MLQKRLPIVVALVLGWIVGGFSGSSPTAVAQVARVTLESLQTQVNNIVGGTTKVGKAATADNATTLGGFAAAAFATSASVSALQTNVTAIQTSYLPLSGGALSGNVSTTGTLYGQSGVRVGNATTANASNSGLMRYDGTAISFSDGSSWVPLATQLSGAVVQIVEVQTNANTGISAVIPSDSTVPQQSEGLIILSASITPKYANSDLLIEVFANVSETANSSNVISAAVFRDSTAGAVAANFVPVPGIVTPGNFPLTIRSLVPAASTNATQFKLAVGGDGGNVAVNSGTLGGTVITSLKITEIKR